MSSWVCEECDQPDASVTCGFCQNNFCSNCYERHIDSHSFKTVLDAAGRKIEVPIPFCSLDSNPAKWISVDFSYVCEAHSKGIEVFPLEQAQVLIEYREQGIEILRRAKKIEQVCAFLQDVPSQLERKLLESVERDYEAVMTAVASAKSTFVAEVQKEIAEFRADLSRILGLLEVQKLQPKVTASTKLEEMVFTIPLEELMKSLHAEKWFQYTCNKELVKDIQEYYLSLRRSETLLYKPFEECDWKDDYYCLPGRPFKIFSLAEGEHHFCNLQIKYKKELVWTVLPDGSVFFCGDRVFTICSLLDANYSEYGKIGNLVVLRANPGIIHFDGAVYVFGGKKGDIIQKSIEAFNLYKKRSVALSGQMQFPRSHFCPCAWNRQIFLGPCASTNALEAFDPDENSCEFVYFSLMGTSSVLVPVNEDEIAILAGDVYRYFPNELRGQYLYEENFGFYCPGGVVTCKGKAYFVLRDKEFWKVCCLEEDCKVKEITKVTY